MKEAFLEKVKEQAHQAAEELIGKAHLAEGDILVVGCSSSEVTGERIGTSSSLETAEAVFEGIYEAVRKNGLYLAAQCCEHLNRAIIIEEELAKLNKDLEYYTKFLAGVEKKLSNEKFVANAPEAVVAVERKKQSDATEKIEAIKAAIAALK